MEKITLADLLHEICHAAAIVQDVEISEIISDDRTERVVTARQLAIYVAVEKLGAPRITVYSFFKRGESYISQVVANVALSLEGPGCRQITYKARAIEYLFKTSILCQSLL